MENNSLTDNAVGFLSGTVCVIDDDPTNLNLLGSILANHGFDVLPAGDADNAIELITAGAPDLILLDILLAPQTDGYEICRRLKTDEATQDIPVIFISALDGAIDKVKAFQAGGVDYITKPFLTDEIIARVRSQILQHHIQQQMAIQYEAMQKEISRRRQVESELKQTNKQLEQLVTIDSLSGLTNRKHFIHHFELEWKRMIREKQSLALLLCDIDQFERYNRDHGTPAGDSILQDIAKIFKKAGKRPGDIVARWGEDEFIMLLPRTDQKGAITLAEHIRKETKAFFDSKSADGKNDRVSLSMGVAATIPGFGTRKETFLLSATEALNQAKESASGQICHS